MKQLALIVVLASIICSTGCVPSVNTFCSEEDALFDSQILGTWSDEDGGETWTFAHQNDKEYLLTYRDDTGKAGAFRARLFKVGDKSFLDIEPLRSRTHDNAFYSEHLLSLHSVYMISINGKTGRLGYLDPAWLKARLSKDPTALAHTKVDDVIVLTDTTENLKLFLAANANTPDAFVMSEIIERRK